MIADQALPNIHSARKYQYWLFGGQLACASVVIITVWFDSVTPKLDAVRLFATGLLVLSLVVSFMDRFVLRTRLTDDGVESRDWFGRTQFFPYSELSWLEWKGESIVLTDGARKVSIPKNHLKFPDATTFLKTRYP